MAIDMVFVLLFICWGIVIVGFLMRDYPITALGSFFVLVWGVNSAINGIVGVQDWFTGGLSAITIGLAAYIMIKGGWEGYKEM